MRESRTYGSVRGALSNERPYRDGGASSSRCSRRDGGVAARRARAAAGGPSAHRPSVAASSATAARNIEAFRSGLRELGYMEGRNIAIEFRYADGALGPLARSC